jgi:DnaJ-class molecular chaperone
MLCANYIQDWCTKFGGRVTLERVREELRVATEKPKIDRKPRQALYGMGIGAGRSERTRGGSSGSSHEVEQSYQICPNCKGKGRIWFIFKCGVCSGLGRIVTKHREKVSR